MHALVRLARRAVESQLHRIDGGVQALQIDNVLDRLRRIDWKATARRGQNAGDLYVRRTAALADATVLIVLDSRDDVGE